MISVTSSHLFLLCLLALPSSIHHTQPPSSELSKMLVTFPLTPCLHLQTISSHQNRPHDRAQSRRGTSCRTPAPSWLMLHQATENEGGGEKAGHLFCVLLMLSTKLFFHEGSEAHMETFFLPARRKFSPHLILPSSASIAPSLSCAAVLCLDEFWKVQNLLKYCLIDSYL